MTRKNKDAKFVIYQVLYIFVITVLALKGADLDLGEVMSTEEAVKKTVRDSLISVIDSLTAIGLKFNIEIDTNIITENIELKERLEKLNKEVEDLSQKVSIEPPEKKEEILIEKVKPKLPSPFSKSQTFLQYATNYAENKGNFPVQIFDPSNLNSSLVTVNSKGKKEFELEGQETVLVKFGEQTETVRVLPNKPPEVNIAKVTTQMDKSDIYVKDLQKTTCFRVTVSDERIEQIKVTHSGPISVYGPNKDSKGNLIYTVSLRIAATEDKFDEWVERNENMEEADGRYKANFFFTAVDSKTKHRVQVGDSFFFTEFAK